VFYLFFGSYPCGLIRREPYRFVKKVAKPPTSPAGNLALRRLKVGPLFSMPLRILIADDNAVFRGALRQLLQAVDHWEVFEAQDGREAVSRALELQPNAVILDLAMPLKDGLAAAREISQILPQTPLMMCTMHHSPQVEAEALKAGIHKVVSKSESSLLVEAIRQLLRPAEVGTPVEPAADPPPSPLPKNVA